MKFYFVTVKYLVERYPTKEAYEAWKLAFKPMGHVVSSNYEIGKTDTLHLHLVVGLNHNIFWNKLRGAPPYYHVNVKPLKDASDIGKAIKYMFKEGVLSDEYINHHHEEMNWKLTPYAFINE